ncbi:SGNH/GDSL hydrolase family protein [Rhizobium arsenicireducens]
MGLIKTLGRYAWRKFALDGVSSSGFHKPTHADIFAFIDKVDEVTAALSAAGSLKGEWDASSGVFPGGGVTAKGDTWLVTTAGMTGGRFFAKGDRIVALVVNASTSVFGANWGVIPANARTVVAGVDEGAGTANAIQVTTEDAVTDGTVVLFSLFRATVPGIVSISINGGVALALKTPRNTNASGLSAGQEVWFRVRSSDNTARMISDQDVSALVAQAEAVLEEFQAHYLGRFVSNPTTDGNGNSIIEGAFYWNTTSNVFRYWDGDSWETFPFATVADGAITNAKLADVPTATFMGRTTPGTGPVENNTPEQVRNAIDPALERNSGFVSDGWLNVAVNTINKQIMSRTAHVAKTALSSLQVIFANWWVDPSGYVEAGIGGSATITASIEYPIGVFTQATFSASASTVVANGDQVTTDAIAVDIPEGATFWVRSFYDNPAGIIFRGQLDQTNYGYAEYGVSGIADKTMGGTIVSSGASAYMPLAIIGQTDKPSVALIGDSRTAGTGDTMDETVFVGNLHRSVGEYAGCSVLARGGDRADKFVASHAKRIALVNSYADTVVIATGINDLTAGRSAAQLQADIETMIGYFPTKRVFACTIEPVSDSTDGYITIANQTPRAAANNAGRNTYNAAVRAGLSGAAGYFELADAVEYRRTGVWKVTYGTPHTADGAHATKFGYELPARLWRGKPIQD